MVVRLVNVVPPSVEILRPTIVAAYTVEPATYSPCTRFDPRPFAVVRLVNEAGSATTVVVVVEVAATVVSGMVDATVEVDDRGTVVSTVVGVATRGSSVIAGFANTLLSATTGFDGVPTSVDNCSGSDGVAACVTISGRGAVARQVFFPFSTPHTQTTPFFLRTAPDFVQATDLPRAAIVEYQIVPLGVVAHTTDAFPIFEILPGWVHALPAVSAAFFVFGFELSSPHAARAKAATIKTLINFLDVVTWFMRIAFQGRKMKIRSAPALLPPYGQENSYTSHRIKGLSTLVRMGSRSVGVNGCCRYLAE